MRPPEERFWEKVDQQGPGDCWLWQAGTDEHGYGKFMLRKGLSMQMAHRVAWLFTYGEWPKDKALHTCDNPPCVNPNHLFDGTQTDNMQDCKAKGRMSFPPRRFGSQHWTHRKPERVASGARANKSSLTADDVRSIRSRYADGVASLGALGREYGVTKQAISHIVKRKNWRHLD